MKFRLWVAALLLLFCSSAFASIPTCGPFGNATLDTELDYPIAMFIWGCPTETEGVLKYRCQSFKATNIALPWILKFFPWPAKQAGETANEYALRNWDHFSVRPLDDDERVICKTKLAEIKGVDVSQIILDDELPPPPETWLVTPYRDNTTRAVYEITTEFPSVKIKIGDVNVGVECGDKVAAYSSTITVFEWRKVTITEGEGVTVCRRQ